MNARLTEAIEFSAVARKNGYGHYKSSIGGRSPSLRWPHLYDLLRAKGYSKEKAARISNSRIGTRKNGALKGLPYKNADSKKALKGVLKRYHKKHGMTASASLDDAIAFAFNPNQPRWPANSPGGLGGQFMPDKGADSSSLPGVESGSGTKKDPYVVSDVATAAIMLYRDEHVRLHRPEEVGTLLDQLKAFVDDAKAKGEDAPTYDLCKASVAGTNLFCAESKGIPRVQMPQLAGVPVPGTPAAKLKPNSRGEVDLGPAFKKYLTEELGIKTIEKTVDASHLKASQNELEGGKVAGIALAIETGKYDPLSLFTSMDKYVVDGHHRWAANVGVAADTGKPQMMNVSEVQADIITVLKLANEFAAANGIPQAKFDTGGGGVVGSALTAAIEFAQQVA